MTLRNMSYLVKGADGFRIAARAIRYAIERHKMQAALHASEHRFRAIIEHNADAVVLISAEGKILYISPANERMIGYSADERIGQDVFGLLHSDDRMRIEQLFKQVAQQPGATATTEFRRIHKNGSVRWNEGTVTNLLHEPNVQTIIVNYHDITDRKQAEEALRASEADLVEAQQVAHIGSWRFTPDTMQVRWSDELYRIFEVEKDAFGNSYDAFLKNVHPEDRPLVVATNQKAAAQGDSFEIEYRIVSKSGRLKHIREIGYTRKDAAGKVVGLFGTAQDITDRKQAEAQLRESEERLSKIFHASPIGINIFRMADQRIIEANDAYLALTGYGREESLGCTVQELNLVVHPEARQHWFNTLREHKHIHNQEAELRRKNGEIRQILVSIEFCEINGEPMGLAVVADITDRKRVEQELERFFQFMPDMACIASTDGYFKKINPEWEAVLGYTEAELLAIPFAELIHPDDRAATFEEVEHQTQGDATIHFIKMAHTAGWIGMPLLQWTEQCCLPSRETSPSGKPLKTRCGERMTNWRGASGSARRNWKKRNSPLTPLIAPKANFSPT
ncbi:putative PAS/PAC sensor protein [Candidatus Moduliflexus flocculans]|uniref:histidine kinase n=1 Tax=Candidatus Moduliflexus flocculans TaxID=1499966 RepID=A0A081BRL7_9BACT|nr:putative PAS/PAC sensor protein [Candidatus Moduliflexus flocculans]